MLEYVENGLRELKVKRWGLKVNDREQASTIEKAKIHREPRMEGESFAC
jgi:hypothetical protein